MNFPESVIDELKDRLSAHPVYGALGTLGQLGAFMEHHVYSVWDFMSLVKFLQNEFAPTAWPWTPRGHPSARRFINEIVIEEESDQAPPGADGTARYASHFELYRQAMTEIGADADTVRRFVEVAGRDGIKTALDAEIAPAPAVTFMRTTFGFIETGKPHVVAAAFALGREHVIPSMFRAFLADMGVGEDRAPVFHYYLNRHIHLDEDFHAPLSLLLLNECIGGDPHRLAEAEAAARAAVEARIRFWDGVCAAIERRRGADHTNRSGLLEKS